MTTVMHPTDLRGGCRLVIKSPEVVFEPEDVAALLDRAHDEMLVRGWGQGDYLRADNTVCTLGALGFALGRQPVNHSPFRRTSSLDPRFSPLGKAAVLELTIVTGFDDIPSWNDHRSRTFDDCLDALRRAAKKVREVGLGDVT